METPEEYLNGTKSAALTLFDGIDTYSQILRDSPKPILRGYGNVTAEKFEELFNIWRDRNIETIQLAYSFQKRFLAEEFAFNVLCGSLLQIAYMGIQMFSENCNLPESLPEDLKPLISKKALKFCVGRKFRNLPIGLLIYAGRNQYNHMDEKTLHPLNQKILCYLLPDLHGQQVPRTRLKRFPIRITGLIGWRKYEPYQNDMYSMIIESTIKAR